MSEKETNVPYGKIKSVKMLGNLVRLHRKSQKVRIEDVSGLGNVGSRFVSEFERGKDTAEIGKILKVLELLGLDVIVQPRNQREPVSFVRHRRDIKKKEND